MTDQLMTAAPRQAAAAATVDRYEVATTALARACVVLVGLDIVVVKGISTGLLAALALLPVWIPSLRRYRLAGSVVALIVLCVPSGYVLAQSSTASHAVNSAAQTAWFALLLSGGAAIGIILWARDRIPLHEVVVLFGTGALANALLTTQRSWKFDLAVPVALIVLGLLERHGRKGLAIIAILVIGAVSVVEDGRSLFGFCLLSAMLGLWQLLPAPSATRQSTAPEFVNRRRATGRWMPLGIIVGLGLGLYLVVSSLLVSGALGSELQHRSEAQIEASGSLLAGGRPEWAATVELVKLRPWGFGAGVVPGWSELQAGRAGLASINIDAGGYVDNYMFGQGFELHSIAADLWVSFGLVGAALAVLLLLALLRGLSFRLAARDAPVSVVLVSLLGVWYLLFGPIYSNWLMLCAAVGLVLTLNDGAATPTSAAPASVDG